MDEIKEQNEIDSLVHVAELLQESDLRNRLEMEALEKAQALEEDRIRYVNHV